MAGQELLERDRELAAIRETVDDARDGDGRVVVVRGEAGIGKTTLLHQASTVAREAEVYVFTGLGSLHERHIAHGAIRQLFEAELGKPGRRATLLTGAAAHAAPLFDLAPSHGPTTEFAIQHGVHWLVAGLAEEAPVVLVVDDVQWLDVASLRALLYTARRLGGMRAVLVAGLRTGEPDNPPEVSELENLPGALRLNPGALSLDAAVHFVRGRLGGEAEPTFCGACHAGAGGNPLLLTELVRGIRDAELAPVAENADRVAEIGGTSLAERVQHRIRQLGTGTEEVARTVAILEPNATMRRVSDASRLAAEEVALAADTLVSAGILRNATPLSFTHPLLRAAVDADISAPDRQARHARAAELHRDDGSPPDLLAAHLCQTEVARGEWVLAALREAARLALGRGAPTEAIRFLRRAVDEPADVATRAAVKTEFGRALLRAGDPEGIERLKDVRRDSTDPAQRAEIAELLVTSLGTRGRTTEAEALCAESIAELLETGGQEDLIAGIRAQQGMALLAGAVGPVADIVAGLDAEVERIRAREGRLLPRTTYERLALQSAAAASLLRARHADEIAERVRGALGEPEELRRSAEEGRPLMPAIMLLAWRGCTQDALDLLRIMERVARDRAVVFAIAGNMLLQGLTHMARGDLVAAEAAAEESYALMHADIVRGPPLGLRAAALLERGRVPEAVRLLHDVPAGSLSSAFGQNLRGMRGRVRAAQGRAEEALTDIEAAATDLGGGAITPFLLPARLDLAPALAAVGRYEEALEVARDEVHRAERVGNDRITGEALRVLAGLDDDLRLEHLRRALELLAPTDDRLHHARALVDLGAAMRRAREKKAAREPLREGLEMAHRCGATALEDRARHELEASGARIGRIELSGVESLTPSERRVAELAAEGLSNPEIAQHLFVSRKTVETHLGHCFQKLDISRRSELPEALAF